MSFSWKSQESCEPIVGASPAKQEQPAAAPPPCYICAQRYATKLLATSKIPVCDRCIKFLESVPVIESSISTAQRQEEESSGEETPELELEL